MGIVKKSYKKNCKKKKENFDRNKFFIAIKRKINRYIVSSLIPTQQFLCIPMLSGGAMHLNTKELLSALADACGLARDKIHQDFALQLQELNGSVAMSQFRKYLAPVDGDETAL